MKRVACSLSIRLSRAGLVRSGGAECFLADRADPRLGRRDDVASHELDQALIERLHADRLTGLDGRVHLRNLVLANQVTDGGRADHDLVGSDASLAVFGLDERLRNYGDE